MNKKQNHPRFTDDELSLIKDIFADNDELIRICYRVFFQLPLTLDEESIVKNTFKGDELYSIFDKLFCPRLENEQTFLGIDDWFDLQFSDKSLIEARYLILARQKSINYVRQQLNVLFGKKEEELKEQIKFSSLTEIEKEESLVLIDLTARKEIINKVRMLFSTLRTWAGQKKESKEQMIKRLFTNSNK